MATLLPAAWRCAEGLARSGDSSSLLNAAALMMLLARWPNWLFLCGTAAAGCGCGEVLRLLVLLLPGDSLLSASASVAMEERM